MSSTHGPLTCPACRAIDKADGVEDGNLFPVFIKRIGNERTILDSVKRAQDRAADRVTSFAGSLNFVYLHSVWFGVWILINIGLIGSAAVFDKFPYGLLTMIVSLEAIFLSTFVMVSQNRQAARADIRSQLDFETNLRAEIWAVHIGQALGVDIDHVEEVVRVAIEGSKAELDDS
ncbi:MAG TPA: DUF1003 domain-containing protein [Acidimicrobiales bacterium]|jgi:uncharacterized membrane protein|nr:DUF1003 domain-containing protein [Acidimicrobiales bacterium]